MLSRREFSMCVGTCIVSAIVASCKLVEFGEHIAKAESEEDDEEPI